MKKILLATLLIALTAGNAALAKHHSQDQVTSTQIQEGTSGAPPTVLDVPAPKSRRHMLFSFGLFGMGVHMGWMKRNPEVAQGGGYPILNFSAGTHALGLGTH